MFTVSVSVMLLIKRSSISVTAVKPGLRSRDKTISFDDDDDDKFSPPEFRLALSLLLLLFSALFPLEASLEGVDGGGGGG